MDIKIDRDDLIDRLKAARPRAVKIDAAAQLEHNENVKAAIIAFKDDCKRFARASQTEILHVFSSNKDHGYRGEVEVRFDKPKNHHTYLVPFIDDQLAAIAITKQATFTIGTGTALHKVLTLA